MKVLKFPRTLIKRIYPSAQKTEMNIIVVDVPSEENIADIDTRPNRKAENKEEKTRELASLRSVEEANQFWKNTGKTYCHRNSIKNSCEETLIFHSSHF